jgi:hypothetical protein
VPSTPTCSVSDGRASSRAAEFPPLGHDMLEMIRGI